MREEDQYIDEFFEQNLTGFKMGGASQGWKGVASGLSKKVFWTILKSTGWLRTVAGIIVSSSVILTSMVASNTTSELRSEINTHLQIDQLREQNELNRINTIAANDMKSSNNSIVDFSLTSRNSNTYNYASNDINGRLLLEFNESIVATTLKKDQEETTIYSWNRKETNTNLALKNAQQESQFGGEQDQTKLADGETLNKGINANEEVELGLDLVEEGEATLSSSSNNDFVANDHTYQADFASEASKVKRTERTRDNQNLAEQWRNRSIEFMHPLNFKFEKKADRSLHMTPGMKPIEIKEAMLLSWAISGYVGIATGNTLFTSTKTEDAATQRFLNDGMGPYFQTNTGLRFEARTRKMLYETGIMFNQMKQEVKLSLAPVFEKQSSWNYQDNSYAIVDSSIYFQIVGTDTIEHTAYDTLEIVSQIDSIEIFTNDTLKREKNISTSNVLKYVEIPLIVGYTFNSGPWTTSLKTGVISSFLWKSHYLSVNGQSSGDEYIITKDKFPTVRFDLYAAAELRYLIGRSYFVFGEAYYRRSVTPIHNDPSAKQHYQLFGAKLGAGVYF